MRQVRATAAAVVLLILTAASSHGQCISSVEPVSERGDNPRFLAGPTAWNGSILAVAAPELDREEFQVILYDTNGNALAENEKIQSSGDRLLDVVWNGTDFAVFSVTDDGILALTRVGTDGRVIGLRVVELPDVELQDDDEAEFLWRSDLNVYLLAHTETDGVGDRTILLTQLRRDGKTENQTTIGAASDDSFVRLAVTATGTIGVFFEDENSADVMYVAIRDGVKAKAVMVWDAGDDVLVAARNEQFALLRSVLESGGDTVARWQTIDTSGQVVRRDSFLRTGTGADVEPLLLLARDSEYAFSFLEWRDGLGVGEPFYRLMRFGPEEEEISDTYFAAAVGTRRRRERTEFGFEWTGSAYVSLASNENGDDEDTSLLRLCPLKASISGPRSARPFQAVKLNAVADGGVPGYTYAWTVDQTGFAQGSELLLNFGGPGVHEVHLTVSDDTGTTVASETFMLFISQPRRRPVRK